MACVLGVSFKVINNLNVYIMWGINVIHTLKQNLTAKKDKPVGGFFSSVTWRLGYLCHHLAVSR